MHALRRRGEGAVVAPGSVLDGGGGPGTFTRPMPPSSDADDLDLPPLDGNLGDGEGDEGEGENDPSRHEHDLDEDAIRDDGDAFDDATGEGDAQPELEDPGAEGGWLVDDEPDAGIDIGVLEVSLGEELPTTDVLAGGDEPEPIHALDEDLGGDEDEPHADGGEEGPLADDEELREEDLPELDADEDGDVDDSSLYEGASIGIEDSEELRWADRAWARVGQTRLAEGQSAPLLPEVDLDDSGMLPVPGDDPKLAARDATWRRLDEAGGVTAAALLPGDGVVLALDAPGRPQLVRILPDGTARIIAEIELPAGDDELDGRVTALRWDGARGSLVATGAFGAQAFKPA